MHHTRSVFPRAHEVCSIAGTKCRSSRRGFAPFCGAPDARAREACFIAGTKCRSPRRGFAPFCGALNAGAREACFIAGTKCRSPRRGFAPFCGAPDAGAREACFIAPDAFSVLYTRRAREGTPTVPGTECHSSRRPSSPFCKNGGRGRGILPFRGFASALCSYLHPPSSSARNFSPPDTECHPSHHGFSPFCGALDAGAREACLIAPGVFTVL